MHREGLKGYCNNQHTFMSETISTQIKGYANTTHFFWLINLNWTSMYLSIGKVIKKNQVYEIHYVKFKIKVP